MVATRTVRLRPEGPVAGDDLRRYIENDLVHRLYFESMEPWAQEHQIEGTNVRYSTFVLNTVELVRRFGIELSEDDFKATSVGELARRIGTRS